MITIITTKKFNDKINRAYDTGAEDKKIEIVEDVINSIIQAFDGSDHVYMTMISDILATLTAGNNLPVNDAMRINEMLAQKAAMIMEEEGKKPTKKAKKKSKGKRK